MNEFFYDPVRLIVRALILGVVIGAIYDLFRILRIAVRSDFEPRSGFFKKIKPQKPLFKFKIKNRNKLENASNIAVFFEDILFFAVYGTAEILFFLSENDGEIRIYCLIFTALSFFAYKMTVGKIVIYFSSAVIFFSECLLYWIFYIIIEPVKLIIRSAMRLGRKIYSLTFGKISAAVRRKKSEKLKNMMISFAEKGFGIIEETEYVEKS